MTTFLVRGSSKGKQYQIEAFSADEAISEFLSSQPDALGGFIECYERGERLEDRRYYFTVQELLKRHMIQNRDAVKLLNDMGLEAVENESWYKMLKENAAFWKDNKNAPNDHN